jgi:hypothetical protein
MATRSAAYLAAIRRVDAGGVQKAIDLTEIAGAIHKEFAEKWAPFPLGIVSHCYLGGAYEAHVLTPDLDIIEHYQRGQALPNGLERARGLARTTTYLAIEVYTDLLVCIQHDGSTVAVGDENSV